MLPCTKRRSWRNRLPVPLCPAEWPGWGRRSRCRVSASTGRTSPAGDEGGREEEEGSRCDKRPGGRQKATPCVHYVTSVHVLDKWERQESRRRRWLRKLNKIVHVATTPSAQEVAVSVWAREWQEDRVGGVGWRPGTWWGETGCWLVEFIISADHMCHPETFNSLLGGRHICSFATEPWTERGRERKIERGREKEVCVGVCEWRLGNPRGGKKVVLVVVVVMLGGLAEGLAESGQTKRYVLIPPALTSKTAGNRARLALHSTAPDCCWGLCVFFGPGTVITSLLLSFPPPDLKTRWGRERGRSLHRPI